MGDTSLMVTINRREYEALKRLVEGGAEYQSDRNWISDLIGRIDSDFGLPWQERKSLRQAAEAVCLDDKVAFDDDPAVEISKKKETWVNCWIRLPTEGEES